MTSTERGGTAPVTVTRRGLSPEPPTTAPTPTTTPTCLTFRTGQHSPADYYDYFDCIPSHVWELYKFKQPQIAKVYFNLTTSGPSAVSDFNKVQNLISSKVKLYTTSRN